MAWLYAALRRTFIKLISILFLKILHQKMAEGSFSGNHNSYFTVFLDSLCTVVIFYELNIF